MDHTIRHTTHGCTSACALRKLMCAVRPAGSNTACVQRPGGVTTVRAALSGGRGARVFCVEGGRSDNMARRKETIHPLTLLSCIVLDDDDDNFNPAAATRDICCQGGISFKFLFLFLFQGDVMGSKCRTIYRQGQSTHRVCGQKNNIKH